MDLIKQQLIDIYIYSEPGKAIDATAQGVKIKNWVLKISISQDDCPDNYVIKVEMKSLSAL